MNPIDPLGPASPGTWGGRVAMGLAVLALTALPATTPATPLSYSEDFTSTTFKDTVNTTAFWDTTAGELKLPPFVPTLAGAYDTPGNAARVTVAGDHAYVADGTSGLQVIDISDPTSPSLAGGIDPGGNTQGVAVAGDVAFLADTGALWMIDITDPANPTSLSKHVTPDLALDVAVAGDHAYIAQADSGLRVVDISNPASVPLVADLDTPGAAVGVAVAGDHAFVADFGAGLQVIDISDPANPTIVGSVDTPGSARSVAVAGDHVFLADETSGVQVIDISDPTNPMIVGSYATSGSAYDVAVTGDRALVANTFAGLQVLDITDPTSPAPLGSYDTPDFAFGVALAGDHTLVADGSSGLQVIRTSDTLSSPTVTGTLGLSSFARGIAVAGDHALVANFGDLQVIDLSDPTNPAVAGSYNTPGTALAVAVAGDLAVVTAGGVGLQLIDISDPTNPTATGSIATASTAWDVAVSGDHALVADDVSGLQVIDISDPTNPTIVGNIDPLGFATKVAVAGDHAYVANDYLGLWVFDISDPTTPTTAGSLVTPGTAWGVEVSGDHAFVADGSGLTMIDISDPTNPTLVASTTSAGTVYDVTVAGDHALLAADDAGIENLVVRLSGAMTTNGTGQSLAVDGGTAGIPRARLSATQTGSVAWEVSADAGASWSPFTPDATWTRITVPGDDLHWRSTHTYLGQNPTVSDLALDWLTEHGSITSITDVAGDQGGRVHVDLCRSGYDFADESTDPVTQYGVYRRVDGGASKQPAGPAYESAAAPGQHEVPTLPGAHTFWHDGTFHVRSLAAPKSTSASFPPGTWALVASVPATQSDSYLVEATTDGDSTASGGIDWSVYVVTTHTTTPSVWFVSEPDSGYSVDNIPPEVPQGLAFNGPDTLEWDVAPENDFGHHTVYGSDSPTFDETSTLIDHTIDTTYNVSAYAFAYYHVTTSDHAGNEGGAATIGDPAVAVTGASSPPLAFALHTPRPNPFRSDTTIQFDLPGTERVRLAVFNSAGRLIREVTSGVYPGGRHRIAWDGVDLRGRQVASGIYFARITAGSFVSARRLIVVR